VFEATNLMAQLTAASGGAGQGLFGAAPARGAAFNPIKPLAMKRAMSGTTSVRKLLEAMGARLTSNSRLLQALPPALFIKKNRPSLVNVNAPDEARALGLVHRGRDTCNFGGTLDAPRGLATPDPLTSKALSAIAAALLSVTVMHIQVVDSIADL
jgi:hypothetical protein